MPGLASMTRAKYSPSSFSERVSFQGPAHQARPVAPARRRDASCATFLVMQLKNQFAEIPPVGKGDEGGTVGLASKRAQAPEARPELPRDCSKCICRLDFLRGEEIVGVEELDELPRARRRLDSAPHWRRGLVDRSPLTPRGQRRAISRPRRRATPRQQ